jgi:hypothetical protein
MNIATNIEGTLSPDPNPLASRTLLTGPCRLGVEASVATQGGLLWLLTQTRR